MTDLLEQLARSRVQFLRGAGRPPDDPYEALVILREKASIAQLLEDLWVVTVAHLERGGMPKDFLTRDGEVLLRLADELGGLLVEDRFASERGRAEAATIRSRLAGLVAEVTRAVEWAKESPGVSADPAEVRRRIQEADARNAWLPVSEAVARMRSGGPGPKE